MILNEILKKNEKLTFLVGAGCSVDPPSCLPMGRKMIESMINFICPESEIEEVLGLSDLRFEQIIEIVRDRLDNNLKILDYYSLCDKPNLQHFFFAEMIKEGHFVITTNFDFLIEYALLQQGNLRNDIIPVITKDDYQIYSNPHDLITNCKKPVYKIHGSTKNIITKENTRDSLIATIRAFGSNKDGKNIFQVEPFKRKLFENISNKRSLIVMGYSGSDDFDIIPTLKLLENLKNIIWVNHSQEVKLDELEIFDIYTIRDKSEKQVYDELNSLDKKLIEIWRMNKNINLYKIDVNTSDFVSNMIRNRPNLNSDYFSTRWDDWFKKIIGAPGDLMKYFIAFKIYNDFSIHSSSMRCLVKLKDLAENSGNQLWVSTSITNIGVIYYKQGNYTEALKNFEIALEIADNLGDLSVKANILNNMGLVYKRQRKYPEALKMYRRALDIDKKNEDVLSISTHLINIGTLFKDIEEFSKALEWYEEALKIDVHFGNLPSKAVCHNNIGQIHQIRGNYSESLKCYEEALEINDQLGNLSGKLTSFNNIGFIHCMTEKPYEALVWYEKALNIAEKIGELPGVALILNNIAGINTNLGKLSEALSQYEKALEIFEKSGDLSKITLCNGNIGMIYQKQENYLEAIKYCKTALTIEEQMGKQSSILALLYGLGEIYLALGDLTEALVYFKEALTISNLTEDLYVKASIFNHIGEIYRKEEKFYKALEMHKEASEINEIIGNLLGKAININNIGITFYDKGNLDQALVKFKEAVTIFEELGETSYINRVNRNIEGIQNNKGYLRRII